jgi:hypothetical protein
MNVRIKRLDDVIYVIMISMGCAITRIQGDLRYQNIQN